MKLKQRILFIPVFIVLIYGIYTTVVKIQANRHRRAEILAQIAADELKYNQERDMRTGLPSMHQQPYYDYRDALMTRNLSTKP